MMTIAPLLSHQSVTLTQILGQFKGKKMVLQRTDFCKNTLKKMNRRKAGLNLIAKDPTVKLGEGTRSLDDLAARGCVAALRMVSLWGQTSDHPKSSLWARS